MADYYPTLGGHDGYGVVGGSFNNSADAFQAGYSTSEEIGFVLIPGVAIPSGAQNIQATLRLCVSYLVYDPDIQIYAHDVDNASAPASLSDLTTYAASVTSASSRLQTNGNTGYKYISVSAIVAEIVGRAGWSSGNNILFILRSNKTTSNSFRFYSMEDGRYEPKLTTGYSVPQTYSESISDGAGVNDPAQGTAGPVTYSESISDSAGMGDGNDTWSDTPMIYEASIADGAGVRSRAIHDEQIADDSDTFYPTATEHDGEYVFGDYIYRPTYSSEQDFSLGRTSGGNSLNAWVLIDDVTIPRGSTIHSATLSLYQTSYEASASPNIAVRAQYVSNPTAPTNNLEVTGIISQLGSERVDWTIPVSGPNAWRSVDVTELVQRNVSLTSWNGNNPILFLLQTVPSPYNSNIRFCSYDGDPFIGSKPKLDVSWTREPVEEGDDSITAVAGMGDLASFLVGTSGSVELQVSASGDDGFGSSPGDQFDNSSGYIEIGEKLDGVNYRLPLIFLRFNNVNISPGAGIDEAILYIFGTSTAQSDGFLAKVYCEDADNPIAPTSYTDLISRAKTTTYAYLRRAAGFYSFSWSNGVEYELIDIAPVIQKVIDRPGWVAGNSIVVLIESLERTDYGYRQFASYDAGSSVAAKLNISFHAGPPYKKIFYMDDDADNVGYVEGVSAYYKNIEWVNIGNSGTSDYDVNGWVRFNSVAFNKADTVNNVALKMMSAATNSYSPRWKISFDAHDNSVIPTSYADYYAKTETTEHGDWLFNDYNQNLFFSTGDTVDVGKALSEVFNRAGWASGNAVMAFLKDQITGGYNYQSFRTNKYWNPGVELHVWYTPVTNFTYENDIREEAAQFASIVGGSGAYLLIVGRAGLSSSKLAGVQNGFVITNNAGATVVLAELAPSARISAGVGLQALLGNVEGIVNGLGVAAAILEGINYSGTITSGTGTGEWVFHGDWYSEVISDTAGATVANTPGGARGVTITSGAGVQSLADYSQNLNRSVEESLVIVDAPIFRWLLQILETVDFDSSDTAHTIIPVNEWLQIGHDLTSKWSGSLSIAEQVSLLEAAIIRWAMLVADSFASADAALASVRVLVAEHLGIAGELTSRWAGSLEAQESLWLHETVGRYLYIQDTLAESLAVSDIVRLLMYGVLTETLQISHELISTGQFNLSNAETLALTESILPAFHMLLTDTLTNTDAVTLTWLFAALLADSVTLTDAASRIATLPETVAEELTAATTLSVAQILRQLVAESVRFDLSVRFDPSIDPDGEVWECWVLNTSQFLPSVFSGFDFNSFAVHQGRVLGCKADGVYELGAATDNGSAITPGIILPETTFGTSHRKRFRKAQFGISGTAPVIRVETENGAKTYNVTNARANMDRDIHGRDITIYVSDFDTLDFIELFPVVLAR